MNRRDLFKLLLAAPVAALAAPLLAKEKTPEINPEWVEAAYKIEFVGFWTPSNSGSRWVANYRYNSDTGEFLEFHYPYFHTPTKQ